MPKLETVPLWRWDDSAGIVNQSNRQVIQILMTHSQAMRKREGKMIVELLNAHCIPTVDGRPKLPKFK